MNIQPPGAIEWLLLLLVGGVAGAINGLRSFACQPASVRLIVGAIEGATAFFTTIAVYAILYSIAPVAMGVLAHYFPPLAGYSVPSIGLIGLSGIVAHLGIRQTILAIRGKSS